MPRRPLGLVALVVLLLASPAGASEAVPFGGAPVRGAAPSGSGANRVVGIVSSPTGEGYWQYTAGGRVHAFGDARDHGSVTGSLNRPVVGMASTPTGLGYWLVASDGGIFSFGDARFAGSTGAMKLNRPIVGMASTASGGGYWLVASDGGVFTFGDAPFLGSAGGERLAHPVVGIGASPSGGGYRIATYDGRVFSYGDAPDVGSWAAACKAEPVGAISTRRGGGYWLSTTTFAPAAIPAGADPIDVVAIESANLQSLLHLRQGCQPTPEPRAGRFSSPLPGSVQTSSYGQRTHPIYRKPQFHAGIDLGGRPTTIVAPADGVVVQVANRQGYGLTTVLDHGDGTATVYGHQRSVAVRAGQRVTRGQAIGTVGRTGFATGDHLHFEVRVHGVPTDPRRWL